MCSSIGLHVLLQLAPCKASNMLCRGVKLFIAVSLKTTNVLWKVKCGSVIHMCLRQGWKTHFDFLVEVNLAVSKYLPICHRWNGQPNLWIIANLPLQWDLRTRFNAWDDGAQSHW